MRDRRLDFWRGLCLIDMVLVHLAWEGVNFGALRPALTETFRFAAGGFVFVAGLGIVSVWMPRMATAAACARVRAALWRRAGFLLGVHYVAAASFVMLQLWRGERGAFVASALIRDVVALRDAPPYADILPLYVVLLAVSPAVLALFRRRLWWAAVVASALLFAWGDRHPWMLSPRDGETFPVVLWQALFVAGATFGLALPWIERRARRRAAVLGACAVVFGVLLVAEGGWFGGALVFRKVPLNAAELARYVSLTATILLASTWLWPAIGATTVARTIAMMGRRSLGLYVAHVWVQAPLVILASRSPELGTVQMSFAAVAVAVLAAFGWALDALGRAELRHRELLRGWAAPFSGAAAAAVLLGAIAPWAPPVGVVDTAATGGDAITVVDVEAVDLSLPDGDGPVPEDVAPDGDQARPLGVRDPSMIAA